MVVVRLLLWLQLSFNIVPGLRVERMHTHCSSLWCIGFQDSLNEVEVEMQLVITRRQEWPRAINCIPSDTKLKHLSTQHGYGCVLTVWAHRIAIEQMKTNYWND